MLTPQTHTDFVELKPSQRGYRLDQITLRITDGLTGIFEATLLAPDGSSVWARAWISDDTGTLAEAASERLTAGARVGLTVSLPQNIAPERALYGYMRIESAPLATEQVMRVNLH
jgi:hypothetical protein